MVNQFNQSVIQNVILFAINPAGIIIKVFFYKDALWLILCSLRFRRHIWSSIELYVINVNEPFQVPKTKLYWEKNILFAQSKEIYILENQQLYSTIYADLAYRKVKESNKHTDKYT